MASPAHRRSPDGALPWPEAVAAYREGAGVIQRLGSKFVDWGLPTACPAWNALDLAGHLLCVARRHHRRLDAALAGAPGERLPVGTPLDAVNAAELAGLGVSAGTDRVVAFDAVTTRYAERLDDIDPDRPIGRWDGIGALTVGEHTVLAAGEWHLHAWDLAWALGWDHRPRHPTPLLDVRRRRLGAPAASGDPWAALLTASGRRDTGGDRPLGP